MVKQKEFVDCFDTDLQALSEFFLRNMNELVAKLCKKWFNIYSLINMPPCFGEVVPD